MKKRIIFLSVFFVLFVGALGMSYPTLKSYYKQYRLRNTLNVLKKSDPVIHNHSFVVVVPSFNNEKYCEKNLESIFSQSYPGYRVIYIDDGSTDNTYNVVQNYTHKKNMQGKVSLIRNKEKQGTLHSLYHAIHTCRNDDIIILLEGDDWLASSYVLAKLNEYYNNNKVWMTYGQFIEYPHYEPKLLPASQPIDIKTLRDQKLRDKPFVTSHLRTFYAGLFKKINKEDLQFEGKFFPETYDLAIVFPMMEMAMHHAYFVPDIFYVYNHDNPYDDQGINHEKKQFFEKYIRNLPKYPKLNSHPSYP